MKTKTLTDFQVCLSVLLIQYFCLHGTLPFSKSYPETESTWPTAKNTVEKSFDTWYYTVTCATLCVSFSSKLKANNVFKNHILKLKARGQSIRASKKLFFHVTLKGYSRNALCKFLIKIESTWGGKSKNRHPGWLSCTVVGLSEASTGGVL